MTISHGNVRFIKSTAILYLRNLQNKRNSLSKKPNVSRYVLETVDNRISSLEEKIGMGVIGRASATPLLVEELLSEKTQVCPPGSHDGLAGAERPRPVLFDSIPILDSTLKARCLDLFAAFREDGKHDRLDTVIAEATRILEERLRILSAAPEDCVGVELAKAAFAGTKGALRVSDIDAEQEAAHLLYRGTFGFIRNPVQHRLQQDLNPVRVLQLMGFIDYLLFVAENADSSVAGNDGRP